MSKHTALLGLILCGVVPGLNAQAAPDAILCWSSRSFGSNPRLVVDLRLRSGNENREPSADDIHAVTALGGIVLYRFKVAVLRASLDTSALRQLLGARSGLADVAYPVTDPASRDVRVQVSYDRYITPRDDSALAALGATGFRRL